MLTIRNFLFSLSLSPLLALAWQLPNQAQNTSGTAGTNSGASTGVSETSTVSNPPVISTPTEQTITSTIVPGVSFGITTGVSTTGELSAISTTIPVSTATVASTSSSVTVTNSATGNSVVITLPPQVQVAVNQSAAAIIQTLSTTGGGGANVVSLLTGGAGSQAAAVALTDSLTTAGISPQKAQALVAALDGLFGSTKASLSNLPIAQATSGQLVASNKALKPILVIAQFGAAINVDINKLNDAIVAYNGIILTSEAENLRKLYKDTDFVGIAKVLKELRTSIQ
ncbi:hypothetical protein PN450_21955 [Dolichospermum lemmermannii CS-548]|uniref:hypothetical protein n=1 Tax=Dolichospermum lemmermannii TaxID=54295 RepID=UPI00232EBEFD|nr:hypothetical protein [Dolichospermum lemmermannii]MDB9439394.1 hypothetical protein [Dolichospermum lemmermannii CS-548]